MRYRALTMPAFGSRQKLLAGHDLLPAARADLDIDRILGAERPELLDVSDA